MDCDVRINNSRVITAEKGNAIIEEIICCIKGRGLTLPETDYLLGEVKIEIEARTIV